MTLEPNIETKSGLNKTEGAKVESVPAAPESGVPVEAVESNNASAKISVDQPSTPGEVALETGAIPQAVKPAVEQPVLDPELNTEAAGKRLADILNGGDLEEHGGEVEIVDMWMGNAKDDKN